MARLAFQSLRWVCAASGPVTAVLSEIKGGLKPRSPGQHPENAVVGGRTQ